MINSSNERTLISAVYPANVGHTSSIISFEFNSYDLLISMASFSFSIISDFYVKSTGMSNFGFNIFKNFPELNINNRMKLRIISLSVLTMDYSEFFEEQFNEEYKNDCWSKPNDLRLNHNFFKNLTPNWQRDVALRTDYERRRRGRSISI